MNLIKYYPRFAGNRAGNLLDDIFNKSISDVLGSDFTMNSPAINVVHKEHAFELELAAPGLKKEDFDIRIEDDKLLVSAEVSESTEDSNKKFTRREFNYRSFKRSFYLPEHIRRENIEAKYENGVLRVSLPKLEEDKPDEKVKRVEIS